MSVQQAAAKLASSFGVSSTRINSTNIWGVLVQDGAHATSEVKLQAQQIAQSFGDIAAITVPWSGGQRFVGFSANPEGDRTTLSSGGKAMERLDVVKPYGQQPLYGGSWTCVGDDCLTPWGTKK
jgi:hypothetical protein